MNTVNTPLPNFRNPPVAEVALSVQFEALSRLKTPQLGLLWQQFRDCFPVTEEHAPLETMVERFGISSTRKGSARIQLSTSPPTPRCWFLNEAGTELIQVQRDRFVHNWRKAGTEVDYPRYERIRSTFETELKRFGEFLRKENIGELRPNQCEVTYVNHIQGAGKWSSHGQLARVLTVFQDCYSDGFLESPEDASLRVRYVIRSDSGEPIGRLHIVLDPGYANEDNEPLLILNLTARTAACGEDISCVLDALDLGREWVVRGFASVTTEQMHEAWGRTDAD